MTRPPSPARLAAARFARLTDVQLLSYVRSYQRVRVASAWMQGRHWVTSRRVAKLELRKRGVNFSHLIGG